MSVRASTEKEIETRLINYRKAIKRLRDRGSEASDEAGATIDKKLIELNEMEVKAQSKLDELRRTSDSAWEDAIAEIEKYWDSLGRELKVYDGPIH